MNIPKYIEQYRKDLLFKNYSENTIDNYASQVYLFLKFYDGKQTEPSKINEAQIKDWIMLAKTTNSMKHRLSALKLFYKHTVGQPMKLKYVEYPRSEQKLPTPLSKLEVEAMFKVCDNKKHTAILALLFMCGLRVSEVINLRLEDIDDANMVIHIKQAKGKKDRIVPMNEQLLKVLSDYIYLYSPKVYLFNGQFDLKYTDRSINNVLQNLASKAKITKHVHAHLCRHSCFTQMLSNGVEMAIIQKIAGHKHISQTMMYARITPTIIQNTIPYTI